MPEKRRSQNKKEQKPAEFTSYYNKTMPTNDLKMRCLLNNIFCLYSISTQVHFTEHTDQSNYLYSTFQSQNATQGALHIKTN